ncbi:hypothetical protein UJ101_00294 [Flavobacteriaceae bacterium UJ101]|nr:hypothetical protein UJ101_00294 [Flavobacteriaceae bacterium UJ101]
MLELFIKKVLIFMSPILLFIGLYIFFDPYKIIYDYGDITNIEDAYLGVNRDYVTHEKFKLNKELFPYNSFIFGSSRTMAVKTNSWEKFLPEDAIAFSYNTNGESIYGMYAKIKYLYDNDYPIKNALILLDTDHTFKNPDLELFHYDYSKYSWLNFQVKMFMGYSKKAWVPYLSYVLLGVDKELMENYLTFENDNKTSPKGNDISNERVKKMISNDSIAYYKKLEDRKEFDLTHEREHLKIKITKEMEAMLREIKSIFDHKKTNYKIVINPLYNKNKFNDQDIKVLEDIFGKSSIYDFSGENDITTDLRNYYESSHFKPSVGERMLKEVYK